MINRNFYMDDFVKSVASREETVEAYKCLRKSLADRGFQLTKWICNSEKVMEEIPSEDRSDALSKTFEAEPLAPSILGLQWNVESDSLEICRGTGKEVPAKITQRIVLSHVSSVFDPSGLFFPFTVRMRLLLKGIWKKHGQSWAKQVSPEDEIAFKDWASELSHMNEMAIKRKYLSKNAEVVDLHIFADASLEAMCIVAYFRDQQTGELAYVVGKCRVAPMKQQSIPIYGTIYSHILQQYIPIPIVRKLIEDAHENNYHEGTEYVRSILQQNYWIIGLRNALRNVKLKCVKCRKQQVGGVQPFIADLKKDWKKEFSHLPTLE